MSNRNFGILCSAALLVLYVFPVFAANTVPPNAAEKKAISETSGKAVEATGTSDNAVLEETQGDDHLGYSVAAKVGSGVVALDATGEPPELEPQPADLTGEHSTLWLPLISMIIVLGSGLLGTALVAFRVGKRVARAEEKATMAESEVERLRQEIESLRRATAKTAAERSDGSTHPAY